MNNKPPKLLFLARSFPPLNASGSVRSWSMAKYLARQGWEVTVVTPDPSLWRVTDGPREVALDLQREGIRRITTDHDWRFLRPGHLKTSPSAANRLITGLCRVAARRVGIDADVGWMKPAERSCQKLRPADVDLVLATGGPFGAFGVAKRLAERLGCPYVLDYRDPWTANPHVSRSPRPAQIREETRLIEDCAAVTIVSDTWARDMKLRFPVGNKLHVVSNGYDPEALAGVRPYDFGEFAIVYTGQFLPPKRVITPIMEAIPTLQSTLKRPCSLHYYGSAESHVWEEARRFGVTDRVIIHGRVTRTEALSAIAGASVAVVITTIDAEGADADRGIVTGKIFEAIGLGTPVLLLAPEGSDATRVLDDTACGIRVSGNDGQGIVRALRELLLESHTVGHGAQEYSWPVLGRQMHEILSGVITTKTSPARQRAEAVL